MPNVRASSGMIGTMYLPIFLSLQQLAAAVATKAIVVDISLPPLPLERTRCKSSMRGDFRSRLA